MALTETFYDNQTIGSEDLNNIAIDLGNPTFANFEDDTAYNTDSLNGITASLAGKGIICDGNEMKPSLVNGRVKIDSGICIFESGAKKRITGAIYLDVAADTKQFIYLYNNITLNCIELIVSETSPDSIVNADYVMLAIYNADNTLSDKRVISTAKVNIPSGNRSVTGNITATLQGNQTITIDMGFAGFKFFLYLSGSKYYAFDLSDGEKHIINLSNNTNSRTEGTVRKEGSYLIFGNIHTGSTLGEQIKYDLNFEVR